MIEALSVDPDGDRFEFTVEQPRRLRDDVAGRPTWRAKTQARLAGKDFGSLQLDISQRAHLLDETDVITLPNSLEFAGIAPVTKVESSLARNRAAPAMCSPRP